MSDALFASHPVLASQVAEPMARTIAAFFLGVGTSGLFLSLAALFTADSPNSYYELTAEQHAAPALVQTLGPKVMRIEVLSNAEFDRRRTGNAIAWAAINASPCTIYLREGMQVRFRPDGFGYPGSANFTDPDNADTIAHEMLHCYDGSWHRPLPEQH